MKELVQAIEAAGGHPRFNILEGRDHFILDVYASPILLTESAQGHKQRLTSDERTRTADPLLDDFHHSVEQRTRSSASDRRQNPPAKKASRHSTGV